MFENPFDDLPDDAELAFVTIEHKERERYNILKERAEEWQHVRQAQLEYMTAVHAAASVFGVNELASYELLVLDHKMFDDNFARFFLESHRSVLAVQMMRAKRTRKYSVELDSEAKGKIHGLIGKIRQIVEAADLQDRKKNELFDKLSAFELEIDRARLRLDVAMDTILAVTGVVGQAAKNLMPLGKFAHELTELVAVAKQRMEMKELIAAPEKLRLPAPKVRGKTEPSFGPIDLDDEIRF